MLLQLIVAAARVDFKSRVCSGSSTSRSYKRFQRSIMQHRTTDAEYVSLQFFVISGYLCAGRFMNDVRAL